MEINIEGISITLTSEQLQQIENAKTRKQQELDALKEKFKPGTGVKVLRAFETVDSLSWNDRMYKYVGTIGTVKEFNADMVPMRVKVKHPDGYEWVYIPEVLEPITDIKDLVLTVKDAQEMVQPIWYITASAEITKIAEVVPIDINHVPSEIHAKSILAACQLMVVAQALNQGKKDTYFVYYNRKSKELGIDYYALKEREISPVMFASKELALHTITHFRSLWLDYFMVTE